MSVCWRSVDSRRAKLVLWTEAQLVAWSVGAAMALSVDRGLAVGDVVDEPLRVSLQRSLASSRRKVSS